MLPTPKTPPRTTTQSGSKTPTKQVAPGGPILTPSKNKPTTRPTVYIQVPLVDPSSKQQNEEPNLVIDFMRLAEEKYGFDIIHPDIRTAMDLANDADDNDFDDIDDDGDIDLTTTDNNNNTATSTASTQQQQQQQQQQQNTPAQSASLTASDKPKNRGKVEGKYDLNDPFIDDSETLWEEQAASTKDGFFVYSGPLVQEGDFVVEKADGTLSKRSTNPQANAKETTKKKPQKRKAATDNQAKLPKSKQPKTAEKSKPKAPAAATTAAAAASHHKPIMPKPEPSTTSSSPPAPAQAQAPAQAPAQATSNSNGQPKKPTTPSIEVVQID